MADAGRDWPCRRGVMQSCLRRFPWGASSCLKPALSQATPIFSQGPSCREVEDWAIARERPASRMVTAVKIAPNLVLILDTGVDYTSKRTGCQLLEPFGLARRSSQPRRPDTPASPDSASPASADHRWKRVQRPARNIFGALRDRPKTCLDFVFEEARFRGISQCHFTMAAVDPFRPGRIHHITPLRAWPAAPGCRDSSRASTPMDAASVPRS